MKNNAYIYGGLALAGAALTIALIHYFNQKKGSDSGWIKPAEGRLTSPVGIRIDPLTGNKIESHNGQDIALVMNTPIRDARDGMVISTTPTTAGGNQVIVQHNNGWRTGYAHLNSVVVKTGQHVKQGDIIAYSGNTGSHTTGPHLHFTMKDAQGNTLDPRDYVYTS